MSGMEMTGALYRTTWPVAHTSEHSARATETLETDAPLDAHCNLGADGVARFYSRGLHSNQAFAGSAPYFHVPSLVDALIFADGRWWQHLGGLARVVDGAWCVEHLLNSDTGAARRQNAAHASIGIERHLDRIATDGAR